MESGGFSWFQLERERRFRSEKELVSCEERELVSVAVTRTNRFQTDSFGNG
jgi:hypothetical protein